MRLWFKIAQVLKITYVYQKKICFGRSFFDARKWVKVNYQGNVMVFIGNRLPMENVLICVMCGNLCQVQNGEI